MAYHVKLTARAERDLGWIFFVKNAEESQAARKWYFGLRDAILSLEDNPQRCPKTNENSRLSQLLYGKKPHIYRIIFRISEKKQVVEVLHIRHGARRKFTSN